LLFTTVSCHPTFAIPILETLTIDGNVPISQRDKYGATLLHWAAMYGQYDVVKWIMKNGGFNNFKVNWEEGETKTFLVLSYFEYLFS